MPPRDERKGFLKYFDLSVIINILAWIVMGSFYVGVYKAELKDVQTKLDEIGGVKIENSKRLTALESSKALMDQKTATFDSQDKIIESRLNRLEDSIPKITLLNEQLSNLKETTSEMKKSLDKIPDIQIDLAQVKALLERNLKDDKK